MKVMDDLMDKFMDWAVFDDIGDLVGIKDDAPKEAADAYDEFIKIIQDAEQKGVMI